MNAMILAAGRGERMRPLTDTCPKPLLKVHDKPLIVYHLEALKRAGFNSVVINISWLGEQIRQTLGDGQDYGLDIEYSMEPEALETAGGIIQALDLLDERFIVINGDVFSDFEYVSLRNLLLPVHLVLVPNPLHNRQGDFAIEQGRLSNAEHQRYTFSGISCYDKSFFTSYAEGRRALAPLLRQAADNGRASAQLYKGLWNDVGTIDRLNELNT